MSTERTTHLVSEFATIEYGSKDVRIGDLNRDGAPDILFVQTLDIPKPGTRELQCNTKQVSCLTATTITLARRAIARANPGLSPQEVDLKFVELHYGKELASRVRRYLEERTG